MSNARRAETVPLWPSIARILATLAIFVFHYLGLLGLYQHRLSLWALLTFSFLSGYLAQSRGTARLPWVVRRYFSVMIPHWLVIGPVLVANWIVAYKPISPLTALVTFFGGNLFLENPLYVITWYVTFVLLLYAYLVVDSFLRGWPRLALTVVGFLFFRTWLGYRGVLRRIQRRHVSVVSGSSGRPSVAPAAGPRGGAGPVPGAAVVLPVLPGPRGDPARDGPTHPCSARFRFSSRHCSSAWWRQRSSSG